MKVIFLDIDGVLNVYSEGRDRFGATFHDHLVENLRSVVDATGAKLLLAAHGALPDWLL